jgi:hypothetical protein
MDRSDYLNKALTMAHVMYRKYDPARDFLRVRDLLTNHYLVCGKPFNWGIERWNYARYFVAPMLGAWGLGENAPDPLPDLTNENSLQAIKYWEDSIGIWENEIGEIVAVINPDEHVPWHPAYGLTFFQRHPDYDFLLQEMLEYAEKIFIDKGKLRVFIREHDEKLQLAAARRGYSKKEKPGGYFMEYNLKDLPESDMPQGYRIISMADENDFEKRRKIFGLSFWHKDPNDWPTIFSYQELQKAPDYRKELDLVVTDSQSEYLACCIVWIDSPNKIAHLEPVGSIRLGMGRQVVLEGLRRAAALGAEKAVMESGLRFYEKIGFKRKYPVGHIWTKEKNRTRK